MAEIFSKVGALICIILLGVILRRSGFFREEHFGLLSKIVMRITIPCMIISNFARIEIAGSLLWLVTIGLACNLLTIAFGYATAKRSGAKKQAFNMINYSGYNIGCFALPYVQTFLGPAGVVATCLFDAGNSLMCTGATCSIAETVAKRGTHTTVPFFLKRLFSSIPMDVYITMLIVTFLGIKLPHFVLTLADTVGAANTFLAMLMLGVGVQLHVNAALAGRIACMLFLRYGICALLALAFLNMPWFDAEVRRVLVIVVFSPLSVACPVFTSRCCEDLTEVALSCTLNSLSILISVVTMTALLIFL